MRALVLLGVVGLFVVALQPAVAAAAQHIHIQNFSFVPQEVMVGLGAAVTWDNHDGATHTATDLLCPSTGGPGPCPFDSNNLVTGASFTFNGVVAGLYDYRCRIHGFTGELLVDDPLKAADLAVTDLSVTLNNPSVTWISGMHTIHITISNIGDEAALSSSMKLSYFVGSQERFLLQQNLGIMRPGDSRTFTARWNDVGLVGDIVIQGIADLNGQVPESDENNVVQVVQSFYTPPGVLPGMDLRHPS